MEWLAPDHLLIVSGTAFGEIVVWSLNLREASMEARRHYVFTGHEGSIFGVRVSDALKRSDGRALRLLASCSDDRTIRIWNISELETGILLSKDDIDSSGRDLSRTTGFLNYVSHEAASTSTKLCIATGMGHLSRIWDIRFAFERQLQRSNAYICSIISMGEDATCQKWHLRCKSSGGPFELSHISSKNFHSGKNVWSISVTDVTSDLVAVITGGADSAIVEHSSLVSRAHEAEDHHAVSEWDIKQTMGAIETEGQLEHGSADVQVTQSKGKSKQDCFRSFSAIGTSQLLITTNNGLVLLATLDKENSWLWKRIAAFDGLKGYSVSCHLVADPFEYVFFGDAHGNIYYYHSFFETLKLLTSMDGKITKLIAEILPSRTYEYMSIVVTRHGGQPPVQLRINLGLGGNIHLASTKLFAKWTPEFPQITSATVATHENTEKGLIIGCRDGTIYSYSRLESPGKREFDFKLPLSHGKEAVTAMMWMPDQSHQENIWNPSFGWLYSVGRDGTLAIHHFKGIYRDPVLVHQLSLSFGPNLEGIAINPDSLDISVWGFTSKFFICQNVSAQEDVVMVECGGAHRIWNFAPLEVSTNGNTRGLFSWVKAMKLNLAKINGSSHKIVQSGSHGREIKTCAAAPVSLHRGLGPLIAMGAEDTDITISYYADWHGGQTQLKRLAVLRKHVTGVQSLQWSSDGHFLFSSGGFEEFYVWHLRSVPAVGMGIVCESKCPLDSIDSELRITDFAVLDVGVRTRSSVDDDQWAFLISMVYSDSSVKVSFIG
jgi:WD40 repeat protein